MRIEGLHIFIQDLNWFQLHSEGSDAGLGFGRWSKCALTRPTTPEQSADIQVLNPNHSPENEETKSPTWSEI